MGSELARADFETRRAASEGFENLVELIASQYAHLDAKSARDAATFALTTMIGAVTMSRIVDDSRLASRILNIAKSRLADPRSEPLKAAVGIEQHEA
jgi:TetR/AcrR family transcriptional repressor of nem operon